MPRVGFGEGRSPYLTLILQPHRPEADAINRPALPPIEARVQSECVGQV